MSETNPTARPALADKVAGKVKAAAGGLLGRPDLAEEGELQQSKAAQAEEAARLEAQAEQAADEAHARAELEANAVDQARVDAELDQAGRLEGIDRQQDEAQTRTRAWADRQREAHSRHEAAERVALDRQEESIDAGEAASRRRADDIEREAAEAQRAADALAGARKNIEDRG